MRDFQFMFNVYMSFISNIPSEIFNSSQLAEWSIMVRIGFGRYHLSVAQLPGFLIMFFDTSRLFPAVWKLPTIFVGQEWRKTSFRRSEHRLQSIANWQRREQFPICVSFIHSVYDLPSESYLRFPACTLDAWIGIWQHAFTSKSG